MGDQPSKLFLVSSLRASYVDVRLTSVLLVLVSCPNAAAMAARRRDTSDSRRPAAGPAAEEEEEEEEEGSEDGDAAVGVEAGKEVEGAAIGDGDRCCDMCCLLTPQ